MEIASVDSTESPTAAEHLARSVRSLGEQPPSPPWMGYRDVGCHKLPTAPFMSASFLLAPALALCYPRCGKMCRWPTPPMTVWVFKDPTKL